MLREKITALVAILMITGLVIIFNNKACNKQGSFAEKINWANHKPCKESK